MQFRFKEPFLIAGAALLSLIGCAGSGNSSTTVEATGAERQAPATRVTYAALQTRAERFGDSLIIPTFEKSPEEVVASVDATLAQADQALDELARQDRSSATFDSTILALDNILYPVVTVLNRLYLIKESSPNAAVRTSATEQVQRMQDWYTETQYREDVYLAAKAFEEAHQAGRRPRLYGEDLRLLEETMRDYRRAGLHLDLDTRNRVEALQKELTALSTEFNTNITNANVTVYFAEDEIEGLPEFLVEQAREQGKMEGGRRLYGIKATVTPQFVMAMQNLTQEASRKKLKTARYSVAQEENGPILNELIRVRDEIAHLLGYESWNDYQIEPKMAATGERAIQFIDDLQKGLEPKFREELAAMAELKRKQTGDPDAVIEHWDWRYYENQLKKDAYNIDTEALRVFFPLDNTLAGMFDIFEEIFGITIDELEAPWVWYDGVSLHAVSDTATGEPLGLFYLDLYPREGKYNHFAQFDIIGGKQLPTGEYQRPVCALVCNFTPPRGDAPSLLSHSEVETLFHEFGHAMHTILTKARHARFAGTNVPRDFVEAPSQMLEAWVWDTEVLDRFAADYRDPTRKINPEVLARMEDAKNATVATFYRRQLAFAMADLWMHSEGEYKDSQDVMNRALTEIFLAPPSDTNMAAYWGHLTGYDAGYYGYAWADSIAADLATAFEQSPQGLMSPVIGRRLREQIYASGGGRDVEKSIRAFLGRERSIEPFLKQLGIED